MGLWRLKLPGPEAQKFFGSFFQKRTAFFLLRGRMVRGFDEARRVAGKWALVLCFLLCALPVGVMSALVTPPGQSPDEPKQLARAAGLLHGAVLAVRKVAPDFDENSGKPELQAGMKVDEGLYVAARGQMTWIGGRQVETAQNFLALRAQMPDHRQVFINAPNTATYFPAAYIPAAFGLAFGLAVKAAPYACILLARLFALLAFLALGALAIWVAEYGEALLLTVLLLPMTLFLAGTENQDGMLIAMACLACAAITRESAGWRVLGLVVFGLFLGAKPPYLLMLGAFTFPLFGPGFLRRFGSIALVCVPVLLWVALISHNVVVPFGRPEYHPGPLYTGDRGVLMDHANIHENLKILLAQPSRFFILPWRSLNMLGMLIPWSMVGVLGLVNIPVAPAMCDAWYAGFGIALLGLVAQRRPVANPLGEKIINFFVVGLLGTATIWLLLIMLYLDWTDVGQAYPEGIQGRYLLPLAAIPALRAARLSLAIYTAGYSAGRAGDAIGTTRYWLCADEISLELLFALERKSLLFLKKKKQKDFY